MSGGAAFLDYDNDARRDLAIGIVSDWGSNLRGIVAELELDRYFDFVLPSGAVGVAKPNPAFFATIGEERESNPFPAPCMQHAGSFNLWDAGEVAAWEQRERARTRAGVLSETISTLPSASPAS